MNLEFLGRFEKLGLGLKRERRKREEEERETIQGNERTGSGAFI